MLYRVSCMLNYIDIFLFPPWDCLMLCEWSASKACFAARWWVPCVIMTWWAFWEGMLMSDWRWSSRAALHLMAKIRRLVQISYLHFSGDGSYEWCYAACMHVGCRTPARQDVFLFFFRTMFLICWQLSEGALWTNHSNSKVVESPKRHCSPKKRLMSDRDFNTFFVFGGVVSNGRPASKSFHAAYCWTRIVMCRPASKYFHAAYCWTRIVMCRGVYTAVVSGRHFKARAALH